MEYKDLAKLAKMASNSNPSTTYSLEGENYTVADVNATLRNELNKIAGNYHLYEENKHTIFALIEETIDDVLPKRVIEEYGQFAEFQQVAQGDKALFKQRITAASRRRAKQFITRVGLAGVYEVFKLDGREIELPITAFGGAAQISIEEFLDGRWDWNELVEIVMEGLDERIYEEIEAALIGIAESVGGLQPSNKYTGNAFDANAMDRLIQIADSYGRATIYCTYEFAATMVPETGWVSDDMRNQKWNNGYLANYHGHNVVVLNQSLVDESNTTKVIDPAYAWIIPAGADKPVKIAFEGQTLVDDRKNDDWSKEIQVYKKLGVGVLVSNNICVYKNTSLTKEVTPEISA